MQVYVERGYSKGDCCYKIQKKHGPYFHILKEKTIPASLFGIIPEKVEVEYYLPPHRGLIGGALDQSPISGSPLQKQALPGQSQPLPQKQALSQNKQTTSSMSNNSTIDFDEAKKRVIAAAGKKPDEVIKEVQDQEDAALLRETNQQEIIKKLNEIQKKIDNKNEPPKTEHPNLIRLAQILRQNDFSDRYTVGLLERARKELSLETLENLDAVQDSFLEWIGESIKIFDEPDRLWSTNTRIMILVGPTGVGKTTTIAKLAAVFSIETPERRALSVRVYTIDSFRIGGIDQLAKYCEIMEIPFSCVDNHNDLRREIDIHREEADLILIDTIGRSPKDSVKLGEMKELLNACGSKAEIHLVLSAITKTSDIEHILRQFEPFDYQSVLLTKLDETRSVGNIISALADREKQVSYITDGQIVPKDIKKASVVRFLINLEEFRVDREKFEKRFPATEANQFQWG